MIGYFMTKAPQIKTNIPKLIPSKCSSSSSLHTAQTSLPPVFRLFHIFTIPVFKGDFLGPLALLLLFHVLQPLRFCFQKDLVSMFYVVFQIPKVLQETITAWADDSGFYFRFCRRFFIFCKLIPQTAIDGCSVGYFYLYSDRFSVGVCSWNNDFN